MDGVWGSGGAGSTVRLRIPSSQELESAQKQRRGEGQAVLEEETILESSKGQQAAYLAGTPIEGPQGCLPVMSPPHPMLMVSRTTCR